jgi:hypothetical protein
VTARLLSLKIHPQTQNENSASLPEDRYFEYRLRDLSRRSPSFIHPRDRQLDPIDKNRRSTARKSSYRRMVAEMVQITIADLTKVLVKFETVDPIG